MDKGSNLYASAKSQRESPDFSGLFCVWRSGLAPFHAKRSITSPPPASCRTNWLGIPAPLETCRQYILLLENEVAELNLQLRAARENIFKRVNMQAQTERDYDEALARLREKAGEAAGYGRKSATLS
ncbi:hypothetical protein [Pseudomonas saponiphila]|uniref:hypothetical protein n=1 Tax=Pseudomonas saponiphila TaxID=556534 RepID=UPI00223E9A14|nr:hypothetical protein [Pseudomonas saponiphila]